uniref:Uncharacterized protein n=1 Tax=Globodera rostochiensis TaxID=31243 RepID=A0A914HT99_GLORO
MELWHFKDLAPKQWPKRRRPKLCFGVLWVGCCSRSTGSPLCSCALRAYNAEWRGGGGNGTLLLVALRRDNERGPCRALKRQPIKLGKHGQ